MNDSIDDNILNTSAIGNDLPLCEYVPCFDEMIYDTYFHELVSIDYLDLKKA